MLEMYMSGEMEAVFQSFRETGFFRASEDHGPTAVFGGITRSLEMDREEMAATLPARSSRTSRAGASPGDSRTRPGTATRCSSSPGP